MSFTLAALSITLLEKYVDVYLVVDAVSLSFTYKYMYEGMMASSSQNIGCTHKSKFCMCEVMKSL